MLAVYISCLLSWQPPLSLEFCQRCKGLCVLSLLGGSCQTVHLGSWGALQPWAPWWAQEKLWFYSLSGFFFFSYSVLCLFISEVEAEIHEPTKEINRMLGSLSKGWKQHNEGARFSLYKGHFCSSAFNKYLLGMSYAWGTAQGAR